MSGQVKEIMTRTCNLIPQRMFSSQMSFGYHPLYIPSTATSTVTHQAEGTVPQQYRSMHNRMVSVHMTTTGLKIERIQFSRVNRNQCGPEHIMKWVKIKDLH